MQNQNEKGSNNEGQFTPNAGRSIYAGTIYTTKTMKSIHTEQIKVKNEIYTPKYMRRSMGFHTPKNVLSSLPFKEFQD